MLYILYTAMFRKRAKIRGFDKACASNSVFVASIGGHLDSRRRFPGRVGGRVEYSCEKGRMLWLITRPCSDRVRYGLRNDPTTECASEETRETRAWWNYRLCTTLDRVRSLKG